MVETHQSAARDIHRNLLLNFRIKRNNIYCMMFFPSFVENAILSSPLWMSILSLADLLHDLCHAKWV